MAKSKDGASSSPDVERLHKSLVSIGVDKEAAKKLTASKSLEHVVIPIYWKEGLESRAHSFWLMKLPEFLKSFTKQFPDGEVRWDPDYEGAEPAEDIAIRVQFNVQEDDQGDHWRPKQTLLDDEAYQKMLERSSYKGTKPVAAHLVVHGR
ncbi:MAG: hypothetical protein OK474_01930 [Thaumarchaeota archaeon]|nr:hypothetical protein [Nitrososphaerota archaeon]